MKANSSYHFWLGEKLGERCIHNLKRHGFDAYFTDTVQEANKLVMSMVAGYETFGFGGSDTIRQTGLVDAIRSEGKTLYNHWQEGISKEQDLDIRLMQGRCDCFFCSANAITVSGEVVNVDGIGNRTNAMSFGPKRIFIIAGINKVTQDLEMAFKRIKEIAAPMRAKSLQIKTPCAETGICTDCNVPQRICRITTILHRKPMLTDITIILINQNLGF